MATQLRSRPDLNEDEWKTRVDLAAAYRLVAHFGMGDLIYNHITARVPGPDHHILINQFGLLYEEIDASSLLKIDLDGNVIDKPADARYGVNLAGYIIHSAVHAARDDVRCVIHTHTTAGCAVGAMEEGLLPISQTALRFLGRVGYHDFEGPATDLAERERLVADLGDNDALVLRHHGLLTVGRTIAEAFHLMQRLEAACQIQVAAMNGTISYPSQLSQERSAELFRPGSNAPGIAVSGRTEFSALKRMLDRQDASYRK